MSNSECLYESKNIKGGYIKLKNFSIFENNILEYLILSVLVVIVIVLILSIYKKIRYNGEDYYQRKTHYYFDNIHGEEYDNEAKMTIEYGEAIPNPRAIDHYRLGTAYLINAQDTNRAHVHFTQALDGILEQKVDVREAAFIIDRIDDYKDRFIDLIDVDELPLQRAMLAYFNEMNNNIKNIEKEKEKISSDDPEFTQKVLLSRQDWQSDSQNVHDSSIYKELENQLNTVISENYKIPNIQLKNYGNIVNWYKLKYDNDKDKLENINKVFRIINNNYPVSMISDDLCEQDIIVNVWRRAFDPRNKNHLNSIREALGDSILDCVEGSSVVCITGRISKIWQSLAKLDVYPEMGILKSKQMLRNEIYQKCAKIVDDYIGKNGSVSEQLKESYNNMENTEQVKELISCIHKEIDDIKIQYENLLEESQLKLIIEECKAVV